MLEVICVGLPKATQPCTSSVYSRYSHAVPACNLLPFSLHSPIPFLAQSLINHKAGQLHLLKSPLPFPSSTPHHYTDLGHISLILSLAPALICSHPGLEIPPRHTPPSDSGYTLHPPTPTNWFLLPGCHATHRGRWGERRGERKDGL